MNNVNELNLRILHLLGLKNPLLNTFNTYTIVGKMLHLAQSYEEWCKYILCSFMVFDKKICETNMTFEEINEKTRQILIGQLEKSFFKKYKQLRTNTIETILRSARESRNWICHEMTRDISAEYNGPQKLDY